MRAKLNEHKVASRPFATDSAAPGGIGTVTIATREASREMNESVASVLAAIKRLPAVELEIDDAHGSAEVRVGTWVVTRIDLERGTVVVTAPADVIPGLQRLFPSSRATANGIVFDVVDCQGRSEALAAINRRANVQRLIPQFRTASL
jgi:hypothetical protein